MGKIEGKSCLKIGITALAIFLCIYYWQTGVNIFLAIIGALVSLMIGGVIAYLVNILMSFFERHYFRKSEKKAVYASRRPVCMLAAFLFVIIALILVVVLVVPELVQSVEILMDKLPAVLEDLAEDETVEQYLPMVSEKLSEVNWTDALNKIREFVIANIGGVAGNISSTVSTVVSSVVNVVLGVIFSVYLLLGKDTLGAQCKELMTHYLKPQIKEKVLYVCSILNQVFHKYIVGKCIEGLILGVLCTVGMFILGLPYAVMVGVLVGVLSFLPVVGAIIGGVIGALMVLTVSPVKAIVFAVFIIVLQQIESNLIYPKVVGNSIGLPAFWVLASVTLGGGIGGAVGMLVSVPIAATAYQLVRNDVRKRRLSSKRGMEAIQKDEDT